MMFCRSLADEDLAFNYDSDNERFSMLKSSLNGFSAHYVFKKYPSYATKTRMGVPFRVYPSIAVDWRLSFSWDYRTTCISESHESRFFVPQPIADAPRLKATGRLVVFADFSPPYYGSEGINPVPSLTEPEVTSSRTITLHVKAHRAAIIDASGKELWSCETLQPPDQSQFSAATVSEASASLDQTSDSQGIAGAARLWLQIGSGRNKSALLFSWKSMARESRTLRRVGSASMAKWGATNRLLIGPFGDGSQADAVLQGLKTERIVAFKWLSPQGQIVEPLN